MGGVEHCLFESLGLGKQFTADLMCDVNTKPQSGQTITQL